MHALYSFHLQDTDVNEGFCILRYTLQNHDPKAIIILMFSYKPSVIDCSVYRQ